MDTTESGLWSQQDMDIGSQVPQAMSDEGSIFPSPTNPAKKQKHTICDKSYVRVGREMRICYTNFSS